jgi:integrase
MLTGCRRDEVGGMLWSEIEGALLVVGAARTKTNVPHEVPLSELAIAQLPERNAGRDFVFGEGARGFQGWSRSKARLDARLSACGASLPAWGLHDFRRTLSTRLNEAGVEPHVVEALLGHAGAKQGVAGVYNRASYRRQKTDALRQWSEIIAKILL